MKGRSELLDILIDAPKNTITSKNFSFSKWLIDSQKLRIYTARSSKSPGISLGRNSKPNQAAEW